MVQILLSNLAIILFTFLAISFISIGLSKVSQFILNGINITLYTAVIISLFYVPIKYGDFLFDLRVVILLFIAITYGWRITIPVLMLTSIWRMAVIGGSAAHVSVIFNMTVPVLIGLYFYKGNNKIFSYGQLFLLVTGIWLVTLMPIIWLAPNGLEIFKSIAIIHFTIFTIGFFILYTLYNILMKYKKLDERVQHMAYYDSLTDLPNRYKLHEYLKKTIVQCEQNNQKLAVLFLDLDQFKYVNDSKGHFTGDALLKQVAKRLTEIVRERDMVARHGGDEFIIILEEIKESQVKEIAQKIIDSFNLPFFLLEEEFFTTTSIGISLYPIDGKDGETLIKRADASMYSAKKHGKNNYQFFVNEQEINIDRKMKLEQGLRKALANNEFILYYQPQYELESNKIKGFEALIRWNHPEFGIIPPSEFIPIAEETGMIVPIGTWVIEAACKQNRSWQEQGYSPMKIAVNVSPVQFQDLNFVKTIEKILEKYHLTPEFLEIEITESIMKDIKEVFVILNLLKEMGIKIAIDDFGTGYSSLNVLNQLPIDYIKIDKSFIDEIATNSKTASLVKTIIEIGKNLKFDLIAEGIENQLQADFLIQHGCRFGQGYLYSPEIPVEKLETVIRRQPVKN